jgi:hypothetical protein
VVNVPNQRFLGCRMGAGDMDYRELSHQADFYTGGLHCGLHINDHHTTSGQVDRVSDQCMICKWLVGSVTCV